LGPAAHRLIVLAVLMGACQGARAQVTTPPSEVASPQEQNSQRVPRVPGVSTFFRGFNAGISYSGVHSSSAGWYQVFIPALNYTFSPHYSADVSAPIYLHRLVENLYPTLQANQRLVLDAGDAGDTLIGFHASFNPHRIEEVATTSLSAPSGSRAKGLGTGRVTFDFNNHTERYAHQMGFLLDLGIGDSSSVVNTLLTQNYSSLGTLAHFQTGAEAWILHRYSIRAVAYEELPFGHQTVYVTEYRNDGDSYPYAAQIVTNTATSENNGFTTLVNLPLSSHVTFSGYYDRSLRQHLDTVSIGMTYVLRGTPFAKRFSIIDRALRAAAGLDDNQH
jgi:hypothetical protein